ncbi:IclR family transcriptional regulator [Natronococcus occultus]|uniref:Transcriptional regulator n=1 Tax=Natronococcus occultus SP4 TaxID=694430 RepID=L0JYX5_9EURY|nr:IclR family transcriptional regulator [Natronococcus occultus]AGB37073.1 transcriptional regulator [Natronococcus occultus SP4]
MNEQTPSREIRTITNMFQIVDVLMKQDGAQVTEIATELDLAKSTVHQQLSTLYNNGYVIKENGEYHVGLKFLTIGEYARQRREWSGLAKQMVEQLAETTNERAQFFIEEHGRAIYLYTAAGERAVQANRQSGELRYLHSSAGGKAILSRMDRERIEKIIDRWGLPQETDQTITDTDELFDELEATRERGYSINKQESISGLWAIAVPVVANGEVVGAFSVSGPRHRMEKDWFQEELPNTLLGTANELEIKIEYS